MEKFGSHSTSKLERGNNKMDNFFDKAYTQLKNSFELFKGYPMGEEITNLMKPMEVEEMNSIEMEIFELSKNIKFKLPKANSYQIKVWIIKIKSICENIQKLCKGLKLGFVYGLFEKILHCIITLAVANNANPGEESQKQKIQEAQVANKKNRRRRGEFATATEIKKIQEDAIEEYEADKNEGKKKIDKLVSKEIRKLRMGGVSLYIQNHQRHAETIGNHVQQLIQAHNKKNSEKKTFMKDLQKHLKQQEKEHNLVKDFNIEQNSLQGGEMRQNGKLLPSSQQQQQKNLLREAYTSTFVKEMAVMDFEMNIKNASFEQDCEHQWVDLADVYRAQKLNALKAVKKLMVHSSQIYKNKQNELELIIENKDKMIQELDDKLKKKQNSCCSATQTLPLILDENLASQNRKCKEEIRNLQLTVQSLNELLKTLNIKQMGLDIANGELKRQNSLLTKKLQLKTKQFDNLKARIKKKSQDISITNGFTLVDEFNPTLNRLKNCRQYSQESLEFKTKSMKKSSSNKQDRNISILSVQKGVHRSKNQVKVEIVRRNKQMKTFYSSNFQGGSFVDRYQEWDGKEENAKKTAKSEKTFEPKKIQFLEQNSGFFQYEAIPSIQPSLENNIPSVISYPNPSAKRNILAKSKIKSKMLKIQNQVFEIFLMSEKKKEQQLICFEDEVASPKKEVVKKNNKIIEEKQKENRQKQRIISQNKNNHHEKEVKNYQKSKLSNKKGTKVLKIAKQQQNNSKVIFRDKKNHRSLHTSFGRQKKFNQPEKSQSQNKKTVLTERQQAGNNFLPNCFANSQQLSLNKSQKQVSCSNYDQLPKTVKSKKNILARQNFTYEKLQFPNSKKKKQRQTSFQGKRRSQYALKKFGFLAGSDGKFDKSLCEVSGKDQQQNKDSDQPSRVEKGCEKRLVTINQDLGDQTTEYNQTAQKIIQKANQQKKENRISIHNIGTPNNTTYREKLKNYFPQEKIVLKRVNNRLMSKTESGFKFYISPEHSQTS